MSMARRVVFQTDANAPGWPMQMLRAIATAKGLGFSLFEIDVTGSMSRKKKARSSSMWLSFGSSTDMEGEEWKAQKKEAEKSDTCVLTVYAVVVE